MDSEVIDYNTYKKFMDKLKDKSNRFGEDVKKSRKRLSSESDSKIKQYETRSKDISEFLGLIDGIISNYENKKILERDDYFKKIIDILKPIETVVDGFSNSFADYIGNLVYTPDEPERIKNRLETEIKILHSDSAMFNSFIQESSMKADSSVKKYISSITKIKDDSSEYSIPWTHYVSLIDKEEESPSKEENFIKALKYLYLSLKTYIRGKNFIRLNNLTEHLNSDESYKDIVSSLKSILVSDYFHKNTENTYFLENHKSLDKYTTKIEKNGRKNYMVVTEKYLKYIILSYETIVVTGQKFLEESKYDGFNKSTYSLIDSIITKLETCIAADNLIEKSNSKSKELLIKDNDRKDIFTFVKIRSDNKHKINDRFSVSSESLRKILRLSYDDKPTPFSESDIKNYRSMFGGGNDSLYKLRTNNFLFGPFNYIFSPDISNRSISSHESIIPIKDRLENGQDVCMIGYGTSGSGKTSSLIYATYEENQQDKDGILINICNQIGSGKSKTNVILSMKELLANIYLDEKTDKILSLPFKIEPSTIIRIPGQKTQKYDDSKREHMDIVDIYKNEMNSLYPQDAIKHNSAKFSDIANDFMNGNGKGRMYYKFMETCIWYSDKHFVFDGNTYMLKKDETSVNKSKNIAVYNYIKAEIDTWRGSTRDTITIGEYILYVLDNKRQVFATPNNPVSSRSHMVVFLKFASTVDTTDLSKSIGPTFIVCDFAGVENRFECDNIDVLNNFKSIKDITLCRRNNDKSCDRSFYQYRLDSIKERDEWKENQRNKSTMAPSDSLLNVSIVKITNETSWRDIRKKFEDAKTNLESFKNDDAGVI